MVQLCSSCSSKHERREPHTYSHPTFSDGEHLTLVTFLGPAGAFMKFFEPHYSKKVMDWNPVVQEVIIYYGLIILYLCIYSSCNTTV